MSKCKGTISEFTSVISRHWNFDMRFSLKVRSQGNECRVHKM